MGQGESKPSRRVKRLSSSNRRKTHAPPRQPEDGRPVVRCDVIPLEWWESLHSEDMDARLEDITLPSLGMLRDVARLGMRRPRKLGPTESDPFSPVNCN